MLQVKSHWRAFTDAVTMPKAVRVFNRLYKKLGVEAESACVEPYYKGGHQVAFYVAVAGLSWAECVVKVIELGQRVGYGWMLTGNVMGDLDGMSNKSSISGLGSVFWQCRAADAVPVL